MKSFDDMIIAHEGTRLKPYVDCCSKEWKECTCEKKGYLTIGNGRNLEEVGISQEECDLMRKNDQGRARREANTFTWFKYLNEPRQLVVLSMLFNMGMTRFLGFKRMVAALELKDYAKAASEMLNSKWSSQVGKRAVELAVIMKTGGMS